MSRVARNGTSAYVGLPEREATKLQDLWDRDEVGVELSVEVKAPVIVGVYPMRIARFVIDQTTGANPDGQGNGWHPPRTAPEDLQRDPTFPRDIPGEPPRTMPGEGTPPPLDARHPE
jgi:hypothetical protein